MAYTDIDFPAEYFETKLYTGNAATDDGVTTQSISSLNFNPSLVWIKPRNRGDASHVLYDQIRGINKRIRSNSTAAEDTTANSVISFDSNGFTVGSRDGINTLNDTMVAWSWKANGAGVSNTAGSITSTVSANTTSGFSIVSYTGTGANATVGHGLGSAPKMVIFKNRDNGTQEWDTYHVGLTNATYFIQLNSSNAQSNTNGALRFNSTAPSTNYFSVGTATTTNESGSAMIAYCFAEKKGFSKFGSYTGNGSTDGTFVYTGFKPAFVIGKSTGRGEDWFMFDNTRSPENVVDNYLAPNTSNAENSSLTTMDFLSNGFKCRGTAGDMNGSGTKIIYMAFASQPFTTSTGVPCTAR